MPSVGLSSYRRELYKLLHKKYKNKYHLKECSVLLGSLRNLNTKELVPSKKMQRHIFNLSIPKDTDLGVRAKNKLNVGDTRCKLSLKNTKRLGGVSGEKVLKSESEGSNDKNKKGKSKKSSVMLSDGSESGSEVKISVRRNVAVTVKKVNKNSRKTAVERVLEIVDSDEDMEDEDKTVCGGVVKSKVVKVETGLENTRSERDQKMMKKAKLERVEVDDKNRTNKSKSEKAEVVFYNGKNEMNKSKPERTKAVLDNSEKEATKPKSKRLEVVLDDSESETNTSKPEITEVVLVDGKRERNRSKPEGTKIVVNNSENETNKSQSEKIQVVLVDIVEETDSPKPETLQVALHNSENETNKPKPKRTAVILADSENETNKPKPERSQVVLVDSENETNKPKPKRLEVVLDNTENETSKPESWRARLVLVDSENETNKSKPEKSEVVLSNRESETSISTPEGTQTLVVILADSEDEFEEHDKLRLGKESKSKTSEVKETIGDTQEQKTNRITSTRRERRKSVILETRSNTKTKDQDNATSEEAPKASNAEDKVLHIFGSTFRQEYKCNFCKQAFDDCFKLKRHMMVHKMKLDETQKKNLYTCYICMKKFSERNVLWTHMRIHSTKQAPVKCTTCNASFKLSHAFHLHKLICNGDTKGSSASSSSNINSTNEMVPSTSEPCSNHPQAILKYRCNICKKKFADVLQMRKHKKLHGLQKLSSIEEVPSTTTRTAVLLVTTTTNPELSGSKFENKNTVEQNKTVIREKQVSEKGTLEAKDLEQNKTDSEPQQLEQNANEQRETVPKILELKPKYKCCEQIFSERSKLFSHMMLKCKGDAGTTNCNPVYVCSVCSDEFNERFHWYQHSKTRHKTLYEQKSNKVVIIRKPRYACGTCYMKFDSITKLRKHKQLRHLGISKLQKTSSKIRLNDFSDLRTEFEQKFCSAEEMGGGGVQDVDDDDNGDVIAFDNPTNFSEAEAEVPKPQEYSESPANVNLTFLVTQVQTFESASMSTRQSEVEKSEGEQTRLNSSISSESGNDAQDFKYRCDICDDVFNEHKDLLEHEAFHREIKKPSLNKKRRRRRDRSKRVSLDMPDLLGETASDSNKKAKKGKRRSSDVRKPPDTSVNHLSGAASLSSTSKPADQNLLSEVATSDQTSSGSVVTEPPGTSRNHLSVAKNLPNTIKPVAQNLLTITVSNASVPGSFNVLTEAPSLVLTTAGTPQQVNTTNTEIPVARSTNSAALWPIQLPQVPIPQFNSPPIVVNEVPTVLTNSFNNAPIVASTSQPLFINPFFTSAVIDQAFLQIVPSNSLEGRVGETNQHPQQDQIRTSTTDMTKSYPRLAAVLSNVPSTSTQPRVKARLKKILPKETPGLLDTGKICCNIESQIKDMYVNVAPTSVLSDVIVLSDDSGDEFNSETRVAEKTVSQEGEEGALQESDLNNSESFLDACRPDPIPPLLPMLPTTPRIFVRNIKELMDPNAKLFTSAEDTGNSQKISAAPEIIEPDSPPDLVIDTSQELPGGSSTESESETVRGEKYNLSKINKCRMCNNVFVNRRSFRKHLKFAKHRKHCSLCDYFNCSRGKLREHYRSDHFGQFMCWYCIVVFSTAEDLLFHENGRRCRGNWNRNKRRSRYASLQFQNTEIPERLERRVLQEAQGELPVLSHELSVLEATPTTTENPHGFLGTPMTFCGAER